VFHFRYIAIFAFGFKDILFVCNKKVMVLSWIKDTKHFIKCA